MVREIIFHRTHRAGPSAREPWLDRSRAGRAPPAPPATARSACRYSTAPSSPSRRLRHCTSPDQPLVPAASASASRVGKRRPAKLLLRASLDRLEARRDARLRRKGGKQGLREAVDGLDPQAARGFEHPARTGAARARSVGGSFGSPSAKRSFSSSCILHPHPGSEPRADAVGHLRRCRLGEGQAEDRSPAPRRDSSSRSTRAVSTCVLPVPADADSAAWARGSAARA